MGLLASLPHSRPGPESWLTGGAIFFFLFPPGAPAQERTPPSSSPCFPQPAGGGAESEGGTPLRCYEVTPAFQAALPPSD